MAGTIGEVGAKVTIDQADIAATIRGLKAIQREARKAAGALRELEMADKSAWTYRVNTIIADTLGKKYRCICADAETAVFAHTTGRTTLFNDMIALDNTGTIKADYRVVEEASNGGV